MEDVKIPEASELTEPLPGGEEPEAIPVPAATTKKKTVPKPKKMDKELPKDADPNNCVTLGGNVIEIKPTKLKYFRNRMAAIFSVLRAIPLNDFLAYQKGVFDENRDSDQILFDFLVAVFDDAKLVTQYYDEMTAADIERVLEIFGRLNHIDEKEEKARKNKEAQATR